MKVLITLSAATVLFYAFIFLTGGSGTMAMRVGGISDSEKSPNEDVQNMLTSLSSEIKSAALASYSSSNGDGASELEEHFKSANVTDLGHKTQIVAGVNYFVRTRIGDYIFHVRIYRDLQKNTSVTRVVGPKQEADPIEYF